MGPWKGDWAPNQVGLRGYEGHLNFDVVTFPQASPGCRVTIQRLLENGTKPFPHPIQPYGPTNEDLLVLLA